MNDLIKREDAIEAMRQRYDDILRTFKRKVKVGEKAIVMDMIGCVKALPSADRPQGEWIDKGADLDGTLYYQCSNCHADVIEEQYPNCPYCLARMKGADDE